MSDDETRRDEPGGQQIMHREQKISFIQNDNAK